MCNVCDNLLRAIDGCRQKPRSWRALQDKMIEGKVAFTRTFESFRFCRSHYNILNSLRAGSDKSCPDARTFLLSVEVKKMLIYWDAMHGRNGIYALHHRISHATADVRDGHAYVDMTAYTPRLSKVLVSARGTCALRGTRDGRGWEPVPDLNSYRPSGVPALQTFQIR